MVAGMKFTCLNRDVSSGSGPLLDQAARHGILERIRDLNTNLVSVYCGTPSTQDADKNNKEQSCTKLTQEEEAS
jgi:hypothetical protein